eukprot:Platyproteum_vivax@DN1804_c0_g1_i1.p1
MGKTEVDPMDDRERFAINAQAEVEAIEVQLKDWFLTRRVNMVRNRSIKKVLDSWKVTGLSMNTSDLPDEKYVMWQELLTGRPTIEDSLSPNAKTMKADMYLDMFKNATDLEHPCRIPGSAYFFCLKDFAQSSEHERQTNCVHKFVSFDACRQGVLREQAAATQRALHRQNVSDQQARNLFNRRAYLLDTFATQGLYIYID